MSAARPANSLIFSCCPPSQLCNFLLLFAQRSPFPATVSADHYSGYLLLLALTLLSTQLPLAYSGCWVTLSCLCPESADCPADSPHVLSAVRPAVLSLHIVCYLPGSLSPPLVSARPANSCLPLVCCLFPSALCSKYVYRLSLSLPPPPPPPPPHPSSVLLLSFSLVPLYWPVGTSAGSTLQYCQHGLTPSLFPYTMPVGHTLDRDMPGTGGTGNRLTRQ